MVINIYYTHITNDIWHINIDKLTKNICFCIVKERKEIWTYGKLFIGISKQYYEVENRTCTGFWISGSSMIKMIKLIAILANSYLSYHFRAHQCKMSVKMNIYNDMNLQESYHLYRNDMTKQSDPFYLYTHSYFHSNISSLNVMIIYIWW